MLDSELRFRYGLSILINSKIIKRSRERLNTSNLTFFNEIQKKERIGGQLYSLFFELKI